MTHQNDNHEYPTVSDANWAARHNTEMARQSLADAKRREKEIEERRLEWLKTPEHERVCSVCGLKLSAVDVARIADQNPTLRHHDFCNPFDEEMASGVARGLVSMLREIYPGEEIPLTEFRKVVEVWRKGRGRCAISQIRLSFPVEEAPITPTKCPSSVSPLDHARMEHERQKEQAERMRSAELHAASIDFDSEGKLRLISKTVAKWREGLSDVEFADLIQTLHSRLPELQRKQIMNVGTAYSRNVPGRGSY